jgi:hypothetical protein
MGLPRHCCSARGSLLPTLCRLFADSLPTLCLRSVRARSGRTSPVRCGGTFSRSIGIATYTAVVIRTSSAWGPRQTPGASGANGPARPAPGVCVGHCTSGPTSGKQAMGGLASQQCHWQRSSGQPRWGRAVRPCGWAVLAPTVLSGPGLADLPICAANSESAVRSGPAVRRAATAAAESQKAPWRLLDRTQFAARPGPLR